MVVLLENTAGNLFGGSFLMDVDQRLAPGFTFAPDMAGGVLVAILPAPDPTVAADALVADFLGLPLDSFRVSLAMIFSFGCVFVKGNKQKAIWFHHDRFFQRGKRMAEQTAALSVIWPLKRKNRGLIMRGILLWLVGIPIPVIILIYFLT